MLCWQQTQQFCVRMSYIDYLVNEVGEVWGQYEVPDMHQPVLLKHDLNAEMKILFTYSLTIIALQTNLAFISVCVCVCVCVVGVTY